MFDLPCGPSGLDGTSAPSVAGEKLGVPLTKIRVDIRSEFGAKDIDYRIIDER